VDVNLVPGGVNLVPEQANYGGTNLVSVGGCKLSPLRVPHDTYTNLVRLGSNLVPV